MESLLSVVDPIIARNPPPVKSESVFGEDNPKVFALGAKYVLTKREICGTIYGYIFGMSPSGKAPDFDSGSRRFESGHPSHDECLI